jgi:hypothetical protein
MDGDENSKKWKPHTVTPLHINNKSDSFRQFRIGLGDSSIPGGRRTGMWKKAALSQMIIVARVSWNRPKYEQSQKLHQDAGSMIYE